MSASIIWLIFGTILIGTEFFIPGIVVIFFGFGALINSLLTLLVSPIGDSIILQIITWLVSSTLSLSFLRKKFSKIFKGSQLEVDNSSDAGETATVVETITPEKPGRIRYQGTTWKATSYTEKIDSGDIAYILRKEGLGFIVSKSNIDR